MTSKKRDDYGRFTAENPKTILMRVTKAEKLLIDIHRLREFFSRDPYQFGSEDHTLSSASKVCSSFKTGEITTSEVLKVYFDVVKDFIESNLHKTQVLSVACLSSSFISEADLKKSLGYKIHLSYRLPWSGASLRRNRSLRWDRTIRKIISYSLTKYIPIETHRFEVGRTRHLHITVDLVLNFPKQLINSFKDLAKSNEPGKYLFGITQKGIIFPISLNSIFSGKYNLLLIKQAYSPMNPQEIENMIENENYDHIRISKATHNDVEDKPRTRTEAHLEAILQDEVLRYVDYFFFVQLDFQEIQQFASDVNWHYQLDRMQASSMDSAKKVFQIERKALEKFLTLNGLDIPIKKYIPPIKMLVSGLGMPGVTSVTTVLVTGNNFLSNSVTIDYERITLRIKETEIVVFDLGCQIAFLDRFTGELSEFIFSDVKTLIFVIDSLDIQSLPRVKHYLEKEIDCLKKYSPSATYFVFLNKIDKIPKKMKEEVIDSISTYLNKDRTLLLPNQFFPTSCQNNTIFKALDVVFEELTRRYFPDMSLTSFKQEFWSLNK